MKSVFFYHYPVGLIGIGENSGAICRVFFAGEKELAGYEISETPAIQKAAAQLSEYFDGKRTIFDLPIALKGTDFQRSVWQALQDIPFGETRSYKEIAAMIGSANACRALGMANHRNPLVILIPCHRVTGKNGSLTGYAGGLAAKQYLLDLEKQYA